MSVHPNSLKNLRRGCVSRDKATRIRTASLGGRAQAAKAQARIEREIVGMSPMGAYLVGYRQGYMKAYLKHRRAA